ncbi:MAG TPA: hypothetical protein VMS31_01790 [Pyrinomonadaceae bacterium]|nr:hypothetical protein [Pyrinomonadaceae bacterium]
MTKNGHNGHRSHGHVTETPDVSHIKNFDVTHETSDVNVGGILKFVIGLTIFGLIVNVLMWGMFRFFDEQERAKEPPKGPMAMSKEERLPPEPRLQAAPGFGVKLANGQWVPLDTREPEAEYRVLLEQWERQLYCRQETEHAGEHKTADHPACMPIDSAIDQLFEGDGLPMRAATKDSANPAEISLPTAASSGRVTGFK